MIRVYNGSVITGRCATCDREYRDHVPGATPLIMYCPDPQPEPLPCGLCGEATGPTHRCLEITTRTITQEEPL